jgi:hypothetical protein
LAHNDFGFVFGFRACSGDKKGGKPMKAPTAGADPKGTSYRTLKRGQAGIALDAASRENALLMERRATIIDPVEMGRNGQSMVDVEVFIDGARNASGMSRWFSDRADGQRGHQRRKLPAAVSRHAKTCLIRLAT